MIQLTNILKEVYFNGFTVSEAASEFSRPENFYKYAEGKGWTAWRGGNNNENGSTAAAIVFEGENKSRMWFKIKYPDKLSEFVGSSVSENQHDYKRVYRAGKRITNKWIKEAYRIRKTPRNYSPDGKPIKRGWQECFQMALEAEGLKPYVESTGVDYTKWHSMKKTSDTNSEENDQDTDETEANFHNKYDAEPSQRSGLSYTHLPDDR